MHKNNGWSQDEIDIMLKFLNNSQKPKMEIFDEIAKKLKRNSLSVRNFYYQYFKENPKQDINIAEHKKFNDEEKKDLVLYILRAKQKGKSVRFAITEYCNGDMKMFSRYQNKYRQILAKEPYYVKKLAERYNIKIDIKEGTKPSKNVDELKENKRLLLEINRKLNTIIDSCNILQ
ncbi:MAG: hypothetical protein RR123_03725 [Clostridia bacterium]